MKTSRRRHARTAYALLELVIAIGVLLVIAAILAVAADGTRRRGRLAGSIENLRQYATAYHAYTHDSMDRIATFSWRAGVNYGFGGVAANDQQAAANQAVDIIRRLGNRPELGTINSWIPHLLYNHLVLADYMGDELPMRWAVSPGDLPRLAWQRDPRRFTELSVNSRPASPGSGSAAARWPYSSSYEIPPAFFTPDQAEGAVQTVTQANTHNTYFVPGNAPFGRRTMSEIAFPSQKAMTYEGVQRFFGPRQAFFAYEEARIPVLMADGSAGIRTTDFCNRGFQPNTPSSPSPTAFTYQPDLGFEPATLSGQQSDVVTGHMRWTRRGLGGRDFGGPEAP
jgi:type II secretory pathway pseudopilin PulG